MKDIIDLINLDIFPSYTELGAPHADSLPKGTTAIHRYRLGHCICWQPLGKHLHLQY